MIVSKQKSTVMKYHGSSYEHDHFWWDKVTLAFRSLSRPKKQIVMVILFATVMVCVSFFLLCDVRQSQVKIYFLDVGQGDCAVIQDQSNYFVIDGGGLQNSGGNDADNTGVKILIPFLMEKKIPYLDAVIVSHMHYDHVQGIIELIRHIDVGRIIISGVWGKAMLSTEEVDPDIFELYEELKACAKEHNIPIDLAFQGYRIESHSLSLECLYPFTDSEFFENENNNSNVFLLKNESFQALFTGDMESTVEEQLQRYFESNQYIEPPQVNVLKVAHHGSKTSSQTDFVQWLHPDCGVISVGKNMFGHPSPMTLTTFANFEIPLFLTQKCGMIEVDISSDCYTIQSYKGEVDNETAKRTY